MSGTLLRPQALLSSFKSCGQLERAFAEESANHFRRLGLFDGRLPAKQVYNKALETQAAERWRASKRGRRCGHVPLNYHLHTIGRADTQRCPECGAAKETVPHFILQCPKYSLQRRAYFGPLGRNGLRLDYLLITKEGVERLFKFINATRQTFSDLQTAERAGRSSGSRSAGGGGGTGDDEHRDGSAPRQLRQTTLSFRPTSS